MAARALRARLRGLRLLEGPPSKVGFALGVGIFVGCSPLYGFQSVLAVLLATLFRLNPLVALLGSQVSFPPLGALIIAGEVSFGEWLRYGNWTPPPVTNARELATWVWQHALLSWALGSLLVGTGLAAVGGAMGWALVSARRKARPQR